MGIKTVSGASLISRFPKPQESKRPPDLARRVEVEPLGTNLEMQISGDESKLNKLETAWLYVLRSRRPDWLGIEPFGLKLAAARCRYHPDFVTLENGRLTAWETKGAWFTDDGKVKLKVAAREYPFIRFVLVRRENLQWIETEVTP